MPALQIRDVPEDIYNEYKRRCAAEDRSMAQQTLRLIKMYLANSSPDAVAVGAHGELGLHPEGCRMGTPTCTVCPTTATQSPWRTSIYNPMADIIGREERIAKRKALFKQIDEHDFSSLELPPGYSSVADLIREDRDNDHGHTFSWEETA